MQRPLHLLPGKGRCEARADQRFADAGVGAPDSECRVREADGGVPGVVLIMRQALMRLMLVSAAEVPCCKCKLSMCGATRLADRS